MNLLFYASADNSNARKVFEIMQLLEQEITLELYRNINPFLQRLRQPTNDLAAVVILAAGMEDLDDMCSIRHFFEDIPVILILPEGSNEYIRKGHLLRPRFLTFAESGQREIGAVLNNMLQKARTSAAQAEMAGMTGDLHGGCPDGDPGTLNEA